MLKRHASLSSQSIKLLGVRSKATKGLIPRVESLVVSQQCYHQLSSLSERNAVDVASRNLSELGVRTQRPPDSLPEETPPEIPPEISDQEWEIRTGRAIDIIQETLPEFFKTGLITSINKITGTPQPPKSSSPIPNASFLEHHTIQDDQEAIYSPNIRLSYTPPVTLPPPFPNTLHVEGLQLYIASSSFIRHTMMALYSDLEVQNVKLAINTPSSTTAISSEKRKISREKSIVLRQIVTGTARVSRKPGEWVIESTYIFSPITGLINQHIVNSIHPAPHQAVYDSLRLGLGKVLGFQWRGGPGTTSNGAAFKGKIEGSNDN